MKTLPNTIKAEIEARNQTILRRFLVERKTYQAIGEEFCLTRERIRQILLRVGLDARWIQEIEREKRFVPKSDYRHLQDALEEVGLKKCSRCHQLKRENEYSASQWAGTKGVRRCRECAYENQVKTALKAGRMKNTQPIEGIRVDMRTIGKNGKPTVKAQIVNLLAEGKSAREAADIAETSLFYVMRIQAELRGRVPEARPRNTNKEEVERLILEGYDNQTIVQMTLAEYSYVAGRRHVLKKKGEL